MNKAEIIVTQLTDKLRDISFLTMIEKDRKVLAEMEKELMAAAAHIKTVNELIHTSGPEKVQGLSINRHTWQENGEQCVIVTKDNSKVYLYREELKFNISQDIIDIIKKLNNNTPSDEQRIAAYRLAKATGACRCEIVTDLYINDKPTISKVGITLYS